MSADLELSRQLTSVVASTPGVTTVYASGSLLRSVALNILNATTSADTDDAKVAITRGPAGEATISVTIGVEAGHPVPVTMRRVSDGIRACLLIQSDPVVVVQEIDVKVSRIENTLFPPPLLDGIDVLQNPL